MKKVVITQSNYIPWKGYFDAVNTADLLVLYDDAQYTKRDWRNRNLIKTPRGKEWLSIPVHVKGKYHQKINEVQVSEPNWWKKHLSAFKQNYARAPFTSLYLDNIEKIYASNKVYLSDINEDFIRFVCRQLGIQTEIRQSREFVLPEGKTERLVDLCLQVGATDYYTGPAARNYIEEDLFTQQGIRLHYLDYSGYPEYRQQFGPFEHAVTIFDLLFNEGDQAFKYMKSFSKNR